MVKSTVKSNLISAVTAITLLGLYTSPASALVHGRSNHHVHHARAAAPEPEPVPIAIPELVEDADSLNLEKRVWTRYRTRLSTEYQTITRQGVDEAPLEQIPTGAALSPNRGQRLNFVGTGNPSLPTANTAPIVVAVSPTAAAPVVSPLAPVNTPPVVKAVQPPAAAVVPSAAAVVPPAAAVVPSAAAVAVANSGSKGKKGISYDYNNPGGIAAWAGKVDWIYNWNMLATTSAPADAEFVPMCWCNTAAFMGPWAANVAQSAARKNPSKYLLGFNEPDLPSTYCPSISPSQAVTSHVQAMSPFYGTHKIGTPGVTNGNSSGMGLNWMTSFLDLCSANSNCHVDFIAMHWYMPVSMGLDKAIANLKDQLNWAHNLATQHGISEIWLTELGWDPTQSPLASDAQTASLINAVVPLLNSFPLLNRYAYFMAANGFLNTGNAINPVTGGAYIAAS